MYVTLSTVDCNRTSTIQTIWSALDQTSLCIHYRLDIVAGGASAGIKTPCRIEYVRRSFDPLPSAAGAR